MVKLWPGVSDVEDALSCTGALNAGEGVILKVVPTPPAPPLKVPP
jgi:hypothetical protein